MSSIERIHVDHDDFSGALTLRYGRIIPDLYREVRRINQRITATEAARMCRPYIFPNGRVELTARVRSAALYQAADRRIRHRQI